MPKRQHPGLPARQITRTEDGVGVAGEQRLQQHRVFGGVIFEVGVLYDAEVAGGLLDGRPHRRAFAPVHLVAKKTDARIAFRQTLQNQGRAVGRTVVDHNQLPVHVFWQGSGQYLSKTALRHGPFVVYRNQN